jgi:predicted Rossmann fold nucleotide-binding protein DprA/Smf involved in DNA uptake
LEENIKRERRFTHKDVEAVINAPEFYQDAKAYFNDVWVQAESSNPTGQTAILKVLSHKSLSITEIADKTTLSLDQVQAALETLQRHEVIKQHDEQYLYTVELMRRWVVSFLSSQQSSTEKR